MKQLSALVAIGAVLCTVATANVLNRNSTEEPEATRTTYNWGQHTKTQAPQQNSTGGAQNGTTYDWGQHTGSTFDWGKYTSTAPPNNNENSTGANTGTTYDWGQHTGSTYDWGQHTGSTYDWGQHTKPTQAPNHNETDNGQNNGNNTNNQNPCGAGSYSCAGAPGLCLKLEQVCNGVIDCPSADDEEPRVCHSAYVPASSNAANTNRFRGQGFMFAIRNIRINGGSQVKLFNQNSDRTVHKSG